MSKKTNDANRKLEKERNFFTFFQRNGRWKDCQLKRGCQIDLKLVRVKITNFLLRVFGEINLVFLLFKY